MMQFLFVFPSLDIIYNLLQPRTEPVCLSGSQTLAHTKVEYGLLLLIGV